MHPASPVAPRRLIVNADDFGRSTSINQAVVEAHERGILTTASLMMNEGALEEAVAAARKLPRLGVGLHLTLVGGHASCAPESIPGLVNTRGDFDADPARAGWRYFFRRELHPLLRREIQTQLDRFESTGLTLDHVNSHHHLHMHPVVMRLVLEEAARRGIRQVRLTRDRARLHWRLGGVRSLARFSHWAAHALLARWARPRLAACGGRTPTSTFGLLQNGRVDADYVRRLLPALPSGDSELYAHPDTGALRHELEALVHPEVVEGIRQWGIRLIRYQDL